MELLLGETWMTASSAGKRTLVVRPRGGAAESIDSGNLESQRPWGA